MEKEKQITPSQYFDFLKNAKKEITVEKLKKSYDVFLKLGEKYNKLGQRESLKKLCFLANTLIKEEKLVDMGITTYIYKDTIEDYIDHVADKAVKIVELSRYTREIPDELVEVVEKVRGIFSELYVLFTDYTGREERKVAKERRDKDPILFGVFKTGTTISDRFYFLGDWVDEYCDLTLDKMIEEYEEAKGHSPANTLKAPESSEELLEVLKTLAPEEEEKDAAILGGTIPVPNYVVKSGEPKKSFFSKIRSFLSGQKS